jgi:hypothetical protein
MLFDHLHSQSWAVKLSAWDVMEDLQDEYEHYHITWIGYVPAFYERAEDN